MGDFLKLPSVMRAAETVHCPPNLCTVLGLIKIAAATGLIVGLTVDKIGIAAAVGLSIYFVLAVGAHIRVKGSPQGNPSSHWHARNQRCNSCHFPLSHPICGTRAREARHFWFKQPASTRAQSLTVLQFSYNGLTRTSHRGRSVSAASGSSPQAMHRPLLRSSLLPATRSRPRSCLCQFRTTP
jgi:hypothetical protein